MARVNVVLNVCGRQEAGRREGGRRGREGRGNPNLSPESPGPQPAFREEQDSVLV